MLLTELSMLWKTLHAGPQCLNIYLFQNEWYFGILLSAKQYTVELKRVWVLSAACQNSDPLSTINQMCGTVQVTVLLYASVPLSLK